MNVSVAQNSSRPPPLQLRTLRVVCFGGEEYSFYSSFSFFLNVAWQMGVGVFIFSTIYHLYSLVVVQSVETWHAPLCAPHVRSQSG